MKKNQVIFFRTDREMNDALAQFLFMNSAVDVKACTFTNDEYCHSFSYNNMGERDWDGVMCGIRVQTTQGDVKIFSSWDDGIEPVDIFSTQEAIPENPDYDFEHAYNMFLRHLNVN